MPSNGWKEIYCSVHREDAHGERHDDFRQKQKREQKLQEPIDGKMTARRDKPRTVEGKALYGRRNHTLQPVFESDGLRGFSLRGKEIVSGERTLLRLAYNPRRLHQWGKGLEPGLQHRRYPEAPQV